MGTLKKVIDKVSEEMSDGTQGANGGIFGVPMDPNQTVAPEKERTLADYADDEQILKEEGSTLAERNFFMRLMINGTPKVSNIMDFVPVEEALRLTQIIAICNRHHVLRETLTPERLRCLLEDLGPTFVKMGQILSKRSDFLPKEYCIELSKLCEESNPLDFEVVKAVIEDQFATELENIFTSFDPEPLGSASIGQVHKAVLKNNEEVVVKIQRPGVEEVMNQDLRLLKGLIKPIAGSKNSALDLGVFIDELAEVTRRELNYLVEARSTIRFGKNLEGNEDISAPRIYDTLTTRRVMTMEYIRGASVSNNKYLEEHHTDRDELGSRMVFNYFKQVLDDGFFHADPHQGNIMVRNGSELVWIDMGMMGELTPAERASLKMGVVALVKKDNAGIINALISMGAAKGELDYPRLYTDIDAITGRYLSLGMGSLDMGDLMGDLMEAMKRNNVEMPSSLYILSRGLITIEGVVSTLSPNISIVDILQKFVKEDMQKTKSFRATAKQDLIQAVVASEKTLEIPGLINDILKNNLKGQTKINIDVSSAQPMVDKIHRDLNTVVICVIVAALFVGSCIMCTTDMRPQILDIPVIGFVGFGLAIFLGAVMFIKIAHESRIDK